MKCSSHQTSDSLSKNTMPTLPSATAYLFAVPSALARASSRNPDVLREEDVGAAYGQ
jgi:hypothetical protein